MGIDPTLGKSRIREIDKALAQANRENDDLRDWITKFSQEMPGEEYFSHDIDGSEEDEILQFIMVTSRWYMTVMEAAEKVDYEPVKTSLMRFYFNPETQEFSQVGPDTNIWYTCKWCKKPMQWNDSPTGGWFSHFIHPEDDHDGEL